MAKKVTLTREDFLEATVKASDKLSDDFMEKTGDFKGAFLLIANCAMITHFIADELFGKEDENEADY